MSDAASRYTVLDTAPFRLRDVLLRWEVILVALLAVVIIANSIISPFFLDIFNLSDATQQFAEKAIIALPMALLILVREIDLSVAAIIALAAMTIGYAADAGAGPLTLFAVGIGVGLLCGMFNGALVTFAGLPSIVVTIGTMSLFRGLTQVILGDQALTKYPPEFTSLGQSYFVKMWDSGIPYVVLPPIYLSFLSFLLLAVLFGVLLHFTATGGACSQLAATQWRRAFPAFRWTASASSFLRFPARFPALGRPFSRPGSARCARISASAWSSTSSPW